MTRNNALQKIVERGGSLDDLATVSGCIISHDLSLDMDIDTLRARLAPLPYIAAIDEHVFSMIVRFLRQREAKKAENPA